MSSTSKVKNVCHFFSMPKITRRKGENFHSAGLKIKTEIFRLKHVEIFEMKMRETS